MSSSVFPVPLSGIQETILDAKGDLIVASAADTPARLAVASTAGYLLTVDSSTSTGLKWSAPAATGFVGVDLYELDPNTISNNTFTALTFSTELFDTDGFHSTVSNTSRITIPSGKGGYYLFRSAAQIQNNATGERLMRFYKNGSFADPQFRLGHDSDGHNSIMLVSWMNLVAGDYIECFVLQNSGGNLNYNPTYFGCQYLGA